MGFTFAAVALRTGTIWPLVVIHALVDLVGFVTTGGATTAGVTGRDIVVATVYAAMFGVYGVLVLRGVRPALGRTAAFTTRTSL